MRVGLIAKKVGMSRFYDSSGLNHPVTILEVENCKIVEVKTLEKKLKAPPPSPEYNNIYG